MKKKKTILPRDLEMHPQDHEVILRSWNEELEDDDGIMNIRVKIGELDGSSVVTKKDAKRIGDWFIKLSQGMS